MFMSNYIFKSINTYIDLYQTLKTSEFNIYFIIKSLLLSAPQRGSSSDITRALLNAKLESKNSHYWDDLALLQLDYIFKLLNCFPYMTKCYARVLTGWLYLVPFYNFTNPQCLAYMVSTEGTPKENLIYLTIDNLAQARSECGHPSRY